MNERSLDVYAIVLAAGAGRRMGSTTNKIFLLVGGRPILARSLDLFETHPDIAKVVLVAPAGQVIECAQRVVEPFGFKKVSQVVPGGETRHDSEYRGLLALEPAIKSGLCRIVLIHDAVRPFVTKTEIDQLISEARRSGAAIPAVRAGSSIVAADADGYVEGHPGDVWAAQTPQAFDSALVLKAHHEAAKAGFHGTDTASVMERAGHPVSLIPGATSNIKITTSDDLILAEQFARHPHRTGLDQSLGRGSIHV